LEELQHAMAEEARRKLEEEEEEEDAAAPGKKRKGTKGGSSSKKSKIKDGAANLKSAQEQHVKSQGSKKPIFIQPKLLAKECVLKDYQLEGVRWLTSLFENGVSGILADEMGLGKTIQVIAMVAHLRSMQVPGPYLIVAPLATLPNWIREFNKWLPSLNVIRYHGTGPEREAMLAKDLNPKNKRNHDFPAIVTSYEVAIKDEKKLNKIGEYTYLVVDEGQRLKNHRCTLIQSLKRIRAANRLLLSGTPIQNNLDELWSLLNFVNPAIFDDLSVFQSWFGFRDIGQKDRRGTKEEDILLEQRKNQTVTKLHEILRPFLLRRIKRDVLTDLPPKKEVVVYAGMSKLQSGYADLIEKGVLRDVLMSQGIDRARTLSQTNKQMNHRKNANHPFLFGEPIDPGTGVHMGSAHPQLLIRASGKFALLDRMLERLHKDKHQVLIFSQMTALLDVIEDYLRWRDWNYCRIDGSTHIDERQRQMDVFNKEKTNGSDGKRNDADDRHFVFLLSTRAGGLGINLASADTCIIFDSDWNPHQDAQAQDRCYRIGQNRPVAVYRLLTVNSVDVEMMEAQMSKNKLARMAISGGDFRKAGVRSKGDFDVNKLTNLLEDDIKDLQSKGADVENIRISDAEFEAIMNRKTLFATGDEAVPSEGKMYDIVDGNKGDMIGGLA
jgi:ATP-dependent DNA helicase